MTDFTQMHVFFAVTTAAVILVTALVSGVLVMAIRVLRTMNRIAGSVEEEAAEIRADLSELREGVKRKFRFVPWITFFRKTHKRISGRTPSRKNTRNN